MKIDCLIEITAQFFSPGEKVCSSELEEFSAWETDWEDCVKDIPTQGSDPDVEFTDSTVGLSYRYITDGDCSYHFDCALAGEIDAMGDNWFKESARDFCETAKKVKDELEHKQKSPVDYVALGLVLSREEPKPVTLIKWIEALGYWSTSDSWTGEVDCGFDFYGRVKLQDIAAMLKQKEAK